MTPPQVAVLMATYNGEKYISEQIESILAQEHVSVTLFVRDDHSADNTRSIVESYAVSAGRVVLMPSKEGRLNVTRNFFSIVCDIDLTGFDYISYSDQDDVWMPQKLSAAIRAITDNGVQCYASNLIRGDASGKRAERQAWTSRLLQSLFNRKSNRQTQWDHYLEAASAGCTLVLNKKAAQYFQERLHEIYDRIPEDASHDWSTYAITRIGGKQWYIDSNAYIIYRQHGDNAYGTNAGIRGVSKLANLFKSGWYRRHIAMIGELYNNTDQDPPFMQQLNGYRHGSLTSRLRTGYAVSKYRRKFTHRMLLFLLILFGYFR